MKKSLYVVMTVVGLSILALSLATAQGPGKGQGGGGRPGGPGGFGGPPPSPEEMAQRMMEFRTRMLDEMPIADAEKAAAKDALKAKTDARTKLQTKLNSLREATDKENSSDAEVTKSLNEFITAQTQYNKSVAEADGALVKKLSTRSRARLTVTGFIENGIGGGGFGGFGRGPGGPGGPGGRGKGGPGGGDFGKGKGKGTGGGGQTGA